MRLAPPGFPWSGPSAEVNGRRLDRLELSLFTSADNLTGVGVNELGKLAVKPALDGISTDDALWEGSPPADVARLAVLVLRAVVRAGNWEPARKPREAGPLICFPRRKPAHRKTARPI